MTQTSDPKNSRAIGPRGWAIFTLAGGAALASPFLKSSPPEAVPVVATQDAPTYQYGSASPYGSPAGSHAVPPALLPPPPMEQLPLAGGASLAATDALPSSSSYGRPDILPSWAKAETLLDEVVAQGTAAPPPKLPAGGGVHFKPEGMRPWTNSDRPAEPPSPPSLDRHLAEHGRWSTETNTTATPAAAVAQSAPRWPDSAQALAVLEQQRNNRVPVHAAAGQGAGNLVGRNQRSGPLPAPATQPAQRTPQFVYQPGLQP